jgi:hypothetical protein
MILETEKRVKYDDINNLYDATGLSNALGITREMIYYYKRKGYLNGFSVSGCKQLYTKEEVINFLIKQGYKIEGGTNETTETNNMGD